MKKIFAVGAMIAATFGLLILCSIISEYTTKEIWLSLMLTFSFAIFFIVAFIAIVVVFLSLQSDRDQVEQYCKNKREEADLYQKTKCAETDQYCRKENSKCEQAILIAQKAADKYSKTKREEADNYYTSRCSEANSYYRQKCSEADQYAASLPEKTVLECIAAREKTEEYCRTKRQEADRRYLEAHKDLEEAVQKATSNLTAIPYMAGIIADFKTRNLEMLASSLDWGANVARQNKVASIREIRKQTVEAIASSKEAEYQLAYAVQMFPGLEDFLETDYSDVQDISIPDIEAEHHDSVRNFLTKEEFQSLPNVERNQLALDRYLQAHKRTNWQVGRDYEMYVGYKCSQEGYSVEYYGANKGLEDLGRDIIAKKDDATLIIQCKYWGKNKVIREKHINQLYGTAICYCYENDIPQDKVLAVLVTNIAVSDTAKSFAQYLGVAVVENLAADNYPCIKCNINRDEQGNPTYIYHLPFDQQYDSCKINEPGEFFALTCAEAEAAGFRRAYRWHSHDS